jgi:hypothetical protein
LEEPGVEASPEEFGSEPSTEEDRVGSSSSGAEEESEEEQAARKNSADAPIPITIFFLISIKVSSLNSFLF